MIKNMIHPKAEKSSNKKQKLYEKKHDRPTTTLILRTLLRGIQKLYIFFVVATNSTHPVAE